MNDLIDQIFGDRSITLNCEGGECLHFSQVPGYIVRAPTCFALYSTADRMVPAAAEARQRTLGCSEHPRRRPVRRPGISP
jgi:hypothetical protein